MSDDLFDRKEGKNHLTPTLSPSGEGEREAAPVVPASVDYVPSEGGRWRIERFEALAGELPLRELALTSPRPSPPAEREETLDWSLAARLFHELVSQAHPRWWTIVRRLYGLAPLVPSPDADLDDLRLWERGELCAALGIESKQLQAELDTLRGVMHGTAAPPEPEPRATTAAFDAQGEGRLVLDDELLLKYGYSETMFNIRTRLLTVEMRDGQQVTEAKWVDRDAALNAQERGWFVGRLRQWTRLLDETMTTSLARNALFNELQIRRIEAEMANLSPTAGGYDDLAKRHAALAKGFAEQLTALEERFPEFGSTAAKIGFKACLHDITRAYLEYTLREDTRLLDRVRTAAELEVDFRQSKQAPEARYRLGQTVYIGEAIAGIFDPNWRTSLKPAVLAKLDRGMKEGINKAREERGEVLVDLEADGEAGEYPGLAVAEKGKS